jgi:lipopolysaccharide export system protein LptA
MLTRLTHSAIAFAVTVVLYQAYVLAVVPFVEPEWSPEELAEAATEEHFEEGRQAPDKSRELLAAYFPAEHWSLEKRPITIENGQTLIVLDEKYTQSQQGELRVPHCAIVFFPKTRVRGVAPPRDAIVLEPTGGAVLQMDRTAASGSGFGNMQFGQLGGEIRVRSDMREPGPQDDLLIVTRDLYMNEDGIRTARSDEAVTMQIGPHAGRGRGLDIRFLKSDRSSGSAQGTLYGKLESLKLLTEVSAEIAAGGLSFLEEATGVSPKADAAATSGDPLAQSPVRIQSAGPLEIEFNHYNTTFFQKVRVRQVQPDGKLDQLLAEDHLILYFNKANRWNAGGDGVAPTSATPAGESFAIEPASIFALGTAEAPVMLQAPSRDAAAQCKQMWIELTKRKIILSGGEEGGMVALRHRGAEIHSPSVEYTLPPQNSPARIGLLRATGNGRLNAVLDPARPDATMEVRWTQSLQVVRRRDAKGHEQPVLILDGRPKVSMPGTGELYADALEVFLREVESTAATSKSPSDGSPIPASVVPELLTARGRVAIRSTQLTGDVNQLDIRIERPADVAGPVAAAQAPSGATPGAPPAAMFSAAQLMPSAGRGPERFYEIKGVVLKLNVAMRDRQVDVTRVNVSGNVDFKELPISGGAPTLRILAERLKVTGANTLDTEIEIRGAGGQNGAPLENAEIEAQGAQILAPLVTIHRGRREALIDSPGVVEMLVDRDLSGQPLAAPEPMEIKWQDRLRLDGNRLSFIGNVQVTNSTGWLRTAELVAQIAGPSLFDGVSGGQRPQLEQLECTGGAVAEFDQRDGNGFVSRQHVEVQTMIANQLSGEIRGDGPGKIDSIHHSRGNAGLLAPIGGPAAAAAPPANGPPQLRHLHIEFDSGVGGNLHAKTVNVYGNVRTVYGPIEDWQQRLAMTPGGVPGPETIWLNCDKLQVTESPAVVRQMPPQRLVELLAEGRVEIEGKDEKQGSFVANGHRTTFDQAKSMLVLQGDGTTPAMLSIQERPGAQYQTSTAQKLTYWQSTGRVSVEGLQKAGGNFLDQAQQPGAALPR